MEPSDYNPLDVIGASASDRRLGGDAYDLPAPPALDEGTVEWVEMDHRNGIARAHHTSDCQACGEPVRWDHEHVLAMVTLEERTGFVRPRFCDRACWAEWASRPLRVGFQWKSRGSRPWRGEKRPGILYR